MKVKELLEPQWYVMYYDETAFEKSLGVKAKDFFEAGLVSQRLDTDEGPTMVFALEGGIRGCWKKSIVIEKEVTHICMTAMARREA